MRILDHEDVVRLANRVLAEGNVARSFVGFNAALGKKPLTVLRKQTYGASRHRQELRGQLDDAVEIRCALDVEQCVLPEPRKPRGFTDGLRKHDDVPPCSM